MSISRKLSQKFLTPYMGMPKEIYILTLSKIINALGCFVMPLLTIILTERIGLSTEAAGLYISASGLLFMPASMIGGKLADTIGRKKVIIIFDFISALLYIICGVMEPTMNMIYVLMFAGASMCVAGPAHDSIIADLAPPDKRKGAYALSYMGWNIGFAVGPLIAGMLYKNHLPLIFIGDALTALISLCLILFCIKETINTTKVEVKEEDRNLEKREEGSIISVLLKRPVLIYFSLIILGYNFAYSQWSYLMPLHSVHNFGDLGAKYYGFMASFNGAVVIIFTPILTKLTEKMKNIRIMVYGGLLYIIGFGMLGFLNTLPFFFVSVLIFTFGEIVLAVSVSPFIVDHTPISHRGRMSATLPIIFGMGYTFGPAVMGKVLTYLSIESGWFLIGAIVLVATCLMYVLEKFEDRKNGKKEDLSEEFKVC